MGMILRLQLGESMAAREVPPDPGADYGEVFTRRWIVDLILDLVGYTPEKDLGSHVLVEPSCGTGAFLLPIVERLIASGRLHGRPLHSLGSALQAFDLLDANAERARKAIAVRLSDEGIDTGVAEDLAGGWVKTGDFLLEEHQAGTADYVVGNPPYIRLEAVAKPVMERYRDRCRTMRGRADIYVGFIEQGLRLLRPGAALGYICADRWMRNQYGADLREMITASYAVETVVTMHDVQAFEHPVSAYPAIFTIRATSQERATVVQATGEFGPRDAATVTAWARGSRRRTVSTPRFQATRLDRWFDGRGFWPACSPAQLTLLTDLEARFPPLQDVATGTHVGIGVATGCDDVFLTTDGGIVESDRLLPVLRASDTISGEPRWSGTYLVNPWDELGLVDLRRYPRLARYYDTHAARLRARHIAQRRPHSWYRTIDRVSIELTARPKLVLPDLKVASHPVLDTGRFYPHHNLYYVTSREWDLQVLGGLLLSDLANLFVGAYCVRMRGGCYRFQAQYLRRIRVPRIASIPVAVRRRLAKAFADRDVSGATDAALQAYGLPAGTSLR